MPMPAPTGLPTFLFRSGRDHHRSGGYFRVESHQKESRAQSGHFFFAGCTGFCAEFHPAFVPGAGRTSTLRRTDHSSGLARDPVKRQRSIDLLHIGDTCDYRRGANFAALPNGSHHFRGFAHGLPCHRGRKHRRFLPSERNNDAFGCF